MPIFIERFFIPLCAALLLVLLVTNPIHLTGKQQIVWGSIDVGCAMIASVILHTHNQKKTKAAPALLPKATETIAIASVPSETVRHDGRIVVNNITPAELLENFEHHTSMQADKLMAAYIGKWMKISGRLSEVHPKNEYFIAASMSSKSDGMLAHSVMFSFDPSWESRLETLRRGDPLTIMGQFGRIVSTKIFLEHCEII